MKNDKEYIVNNMGKLKFGHEKFDQIASASILSSSKHLVIATAAHCAYDWQQNQFYKKLVFIPYLGGEKQQYKVVAVAIPKLWIDLAAVEFDTCFLLLEERFTEEYDKKLYGLIPQFNIPMKRNYIISGIRLIPFLKMPYITISQSFEDKYQNSTLIGVKCRRKLAMSGGPWVTFYQGKYVQNSVTSLSMNHVKNVLWGVYWGDVIKKTFEAAEDEQENEQAIIHFWN